MNKKVTEAEIQKVNEEYGRVTKGFVPKFGDEVHIRTVERMGKVANDERLMNLQKGAIARANYQKKCTKARNNSSQRSIIILKNKSMEKFEEVSLKCQCGVSFIWTPGEQNFMNQLLEEGKIQEIKKPKRCPDCREIKKKKFEGYAKESRGY